MAWLIIPHQWALARAAAAAAELVDRNTMSVANLLHQVGCVFSLAILSSLVTTLTMLRRCINKLSYYLRQVNGVNGRDTVFVRCVCVCVCVCVRARARASGVTWHPKFLGVKCQ